MTGSFWVPVPSVLMMVFLARSVSGAVRAARRGRGGGGMSGGINGLASGCRPWTRLQPVPVWSETGHRSHGRPDHVLVDAGDDLARLVALGVHEQELVRNV